MKIMISQPMRGRTDKQIRAERDAIASKLEAQGHEVIDTIFTEEPVDGCDSALFYLGKAIESIGKVDALVFAKGWENARGCRIEYDVAKYYGKFIKFEDFI